MNLNYEAALSTMKVIADYTSADFDSLGILPQDFKMVFEDKPWIRDNRRKVMQTLDALLFGTADVMGLPRIVLPAEFIAGVISTFVAPCNRQVACIWMAEQRATGAKASDLANLGTEAAAEADPCTGQQLFSLIVQLSESSASSEVRQRYFDRMNTRTRKAVNGT